MSYNQFVPVRIVPVNILLYAHLLPPGAKKITSLGCYPLKYHKEEEKLRKDLIERGKKFVTLSGVNYKSHQGMAYYKKKKNIVKVGLQSLLQYVYGTPG